MSRPITITVGDTVLEAELNDSATADAIWQALPIEAGAGMWGDEIYFAISVQASESPDAREVMEVGELAYWPPGNAFCIFYGPTPASQGERPCAASAVNPVGRIVGDATVLRGTTGGTSVRIAAGEQ